MPSDITGVNLLTRQGDGFSFRPGPIFGDLVLGDEINRAPAKTQAALLEAMQERRVTVDGTSHPLSRRLHGLRDPEPDRVRGHLPAARSGAGPLHGQGPDGLSRAGHRAGDSAARARGVRSRPARQLRYSACGRPRRRWPPAPDVPPGAGRAEPDGNTSRRWSARPGTRRCSPWARRPAAAWLCSRWRRPRRCSTAGATSCPTT